MYEVEGQSEGKKSTYLPSLNLFFLRGCLSFGKMPYLAISPHRLPLSTATQPPSQLLYVTLATADHSWTYGYSGLLFRPKKYGDQPSLN